MRIKNDYLIHVLVLLLGMFVCGMIAVHIGKELNWDLASYHFYNPFAYIYQRAALDDWPVEFVHVHLTPTADFLTYYLITFLQPKTAVFSLGALHGINLWLIYYIASELLGGLSRVSYIRSLAIVLAVLGMYGPTVIPGLGSFQHDALVSLFVLGYVALFIKASQLDYSRALLMCAGLMLGISAGLKLTAGIFILSALLSVLILNVSFRQQLRISILLSGGIATGLLLTSGYWMLSQWQHYHNPVFPFMNGVFHSPDFPGYNWKDPRFLPQGLMQALFYPFYFSFDGRTSDVPFRDFRFAVLYVLVIFAMMRRVSLQPRARWLAAFFIIAYVIWQCGFSIMRYAMPLEMLAPLMIFLLLDALASQAVIRAGWVFAFVVMTLLSLRPAQAVRSPWYDGDYFNVNVPPMAVHASRAMVLMPFSAYALAMKPRPQTYLIAFLPDKWRYVGVPFSKQKFTLSPHMAANVNQFNGQIFILSSSEYLPLMTKAAKQLGLTMDGACFDITSDRQKISDEDVKLCPVRKSFSPTHPA